MQKIDGKKIQEEILNEITDRVRLLNFQPVFTDVLVGEDPASAQYVRMKARMAERVGIHFHNASFQASITTRELVEEIKKLNQIPNMCGIIVQLPLPPSIDKRAVLDAIDSRLDVDSLGVTASEKFYNGNTELGFPTALACMHILDSLNLDLKNKNIVVMGQGDLVGKPVTALLKFRGLNPSIVTRQVENKEQLLHDADIIISGIGQGKFLTGDMVKKGV
ncbi:bifunctional 5,10-methylenetetrahydrofolate dehydrogenase/5,10-methenyltetrahydrofolate cyclohydrolase, partial [Patescibacteria group bacterium]|nr:bifunctional 5,10-methylenetetrahydrofolate dehydrogenase/5,10-methenyltetrahydrofolate cyclohydrolase [Patescibacteria group bacterium]